MHPGARLKAELAKPGLITAPGVYDMISVKVAERLGFNALYMTGYGVSASLGLPDAGLISYTEMVGRVAQICQATSTPVICDADTGFGGLLNVERTVRGYEAAGAAAIQLEDQVFPKKCGHTPGRRVVPIDEMVRKIQVAVASRSTADMLIVARTDARTQHGIDEALRRGEAYAKAGADILFIESPETEEEMLAIGRNFDIPLLANMVDGGRTPVLPKKRLEEIGYRIAIFPATGFLATAKALEQVYGVLRDKGSSDTLSSSQLYSFDAFNRVVGFEHVWDFEKRWAEEP
jgi:2-methylisocitrate lyase-like PEP mutase family enzyme